MAKVEILIVCSDEGILNTIIRLIKNNPDWNPAGAANFQEANELLTENAFNIVLIGSGLSAEDERELQLTVVSSQKNIAVIKHYGGGSGLLFGEIFEALSRLNR